MSLTPLCVPLTLQIHVATAKPTEPPAHLSNRHPCFQLPSAEALLELQKRIFEHSKGDSKAKAMECDEPGKENSGAKVGHRLTGNA